MKKVWNSPIGRIISVSLLAGLTYLLLGKLKLLTGSLLPSFITENSDSMGAIYKTLMALISVILMLIIPGKNLSDFGFKLPGRINYLKLVLITIFSTLAGLVVFSIIFMGILSGIYGVEAKGGFDMSGSIWISIIGIWFWSSVAEEIYHRGLLQTLLSVLKKYKFLGLSLAVWFSALFFGAMHLTLFKISNSPFWVLMIVCNTFVLGLIASYYREKSGSIIPAILAHIMANIAGYLPRFFM